jgi:hypothetical protein
MKRNHDDEGNEVVRLELKYCERCGGLWVRECGAGVRRGSGLLRQLPAQRGGVASVETKARADHVAGAKEGGDGRATDGRDGV